MKALRFNKCSSRLLFWLICLEGSFPWLRSKGELFSMESQNSPLAQMIKELYNDRERENQANVLSETIQVLDA